MGRLSVRNKPTLLAPESRPLLGPSSRIGFSVAADINSNVVDIYFLVWSLSRLLCCVGSGSNVAAAFRRMYASALLLILGVRIPPRAWMFVCCGSCVLSGRGLYDELIMRPEESCWLWRVVGCDLGTSRMRRPWPELGLAPEGEKIYVMVWTGSDWLRIKCTDWMRNNQLDQSECYARLWRFHTCCMATQERWDRSQLIHRVRSVASSCCSCRWLPSPADDSRPVRTYIYSPAKLAVWLKRTINIWPRDQTAPTRTKCKSKSVLVIHLISQSLAVSVRTTRFNIKNYTWCSLCLDCFCTAVIINSDFSLYSINVLVFITVVESVYCAVRTDCLYEADYVPSLTF